MERLCSRTHGSSLKGNLDLRAYFEWHLHAEGMDVRRTRVPECGNTEWSRAPYHSKTQTANAGSGVGTGLKIDVSILRRDTPRNYLPGEACSHGN